MLLSAEARKSVTVLFSGEGADELFCGYKRHVRFLRERPTVPRLVASNRVNGVDLANAVFRHPVSDVGMERLALAKAAAKTTPARQLTLFDLRHHLPGLLLRQDKMGMAANLEIRVPFLDRRLVDAALALADDQKIIGNERKRVLREVGEAYIPETVRRRQKRGFGLPVANWLRNPAGLGKMFKRLLLDDQRRQFINYATVRRLYAEHQERVSDHSDALWPLLTLEVWCRCFLDGEVELSTRDRSTIAGVHGRGVAAARSGVLQTSAE